jgi:hypothetical protein
MRHDPFFLCDQHRQCTALLHYEWSGFHQSFHVSTLVWRLKSHLKPVLFPLLRTPTFTCQIAQAPLFHWTFFFVFLNCGQLFRLDKKWKPRGLNPWHPGSLDNLTEKLDCLTMLPRPRSCSLKKDELHPVKQI